MTADHGRQAAMRFEDLSDHLLETLTATLEFYLELAPDGRRLDPAEVEATGSWLEEAAACGRALDVSRDLLTTFAADHDLRPGLRSLRTIQHSLVLALSDDPALRARAIPTEELQARVQPVHARWPEVTEGT